MPSTLVRFTYDATIPIVDSNGRQRQATTDNQGGFLVEIPVLGTWGTGLHVIHATDEAQQTSISTTITVQQPPASPPQLQLITSSIDLGANRAGSISSKQITLVNAGGGEITWQQSSDVAWLAAFPVSNTYVFSGRSLITITGNRSNLTPQAYTGHITFTQKDSTATVRLTVTMKVDPAPAALNVSLSTLTFSATTTQAAAVQYITLQNSGGRPLNWQATTQTDDGANWLYISQASGSIDPNLSEAIGVNVQAQQLAVGSYQGTINLRGGASASITVSLTVVAPGNIVVSPSALSFAASTGQSPAQKTITLQNSGGQSLHWTASAVTADQGNWLDITPTSGSVDQEGQLPITVTINSASLKAGAYQAMLTFTAGSITRLVPISLAMTAPPQAAITIGNTLLSLSTPQGTNPSSQEFTITNTGNATLNWAASESGSGATFAPLSAYRGALLPQSSAAVSVTPKVSTYKAGTSLATTITISDSDAVTTVASQKIPLTITIQQGQAAISLSTTNVSLDTNDNTYLVTIMNTGTGPLNWAAVIQTYSSAEPWLSTDSASGTIAPGKSKTIGISGDATKLAHGTYQGAVVISDSDAGTPVGKQTVAVSFKV